MVFRGASHLRQRQGTRVSRVMNLPLELGRRLVSMLILRTTINNATKACVRAREGSFLRKLGHITSSGLRANRQSSISVTPLMALPRDAALQAPGPFPLRCSTEAGFYCNQPKLPAEQEYACQKLTW